MKFWQKVLPIALIVAHLHQFPSKMFPIALTVSDCQCCQLATPSVLFIIYCQMCLRGQFMNGQNVTFSSGQNDTNLLVLLDTFHSYMNLNI